MNQKDLRHKIIELCLEMNRSGLNQGTSGNISARYKNSMLITPSGIPYNKLKPKHLAKLSLKDDRLEWKGPCKPSSEWHFHRSLLSTRPEFNAVVHTHSTFATTLSVSRKSIPACHYMVAAFGGNNVNCAEYATFGTPELTKNILLAMNNRSACLMANHGMLVAGKDLDHAMWTAIELETLARQYYFASQSGGMVLLPDSEMKTVL
ncbi:MAG: class II aldolase/adducin family protein, partial [Granulosicoccus sp.]|nr:class II aldolase/adducin family protein [Granulosicoccus sp.]